MFGTGIKTILASGLLAATMFGFSGASASAANLELTLGFDGQGIQIQEAGFRHGDENWRGRGHGRRHGGIGRHHKRHGGYSRHNRRRKGCSPRRAVDKAWNMGLNRPHIHRVGDRHIVVKGRYHGSRTKIVFGRFGGCKVVDFRRQDW